MKQSRVILTPVQKGKMNRQNLKPPTSLLLGLIPVIFAILLYANTVPNDFTLDDYGVVLKNRFVKEGFSGIPALLTGTNFAGYDGQNNGVYRPVPMITFAMEFPLAGLDPHFRHLVNILLYGLTGFFLFLLLRKLFPDHPVFLSLSITLLFLAHPVHTDAVANIKGRDEILSFLFSILSIMAFIRYAGKGKWGFLLAGTGCYILAFFSKESSLTFIVIIPLVLYFIKKTTGKHLLYVIVSLVCGMAAMLAWRSFVIYSLSEPMTGEAFSMINNSILSTESLLSRIVTGLWFQTLYLWKLLIPFPLSYDYSYNQIPVVSLFSIRAIASVLLIFFLGYMILRNYRKDPTLSFWLIFYFLTILIVSNIFIYIGATFAERFLYTPSLAFSAITGIFLFKMTGRNAGSQHHREFLKNNRLFMVLVSFILLMYSGITISRNTAWKNNLTLFTADLHHAPNSARVNYNLGNELHEMAKQEPDSIAKAVLLRRSAGSLNRAVAIYPRYLDAIYVLGLVYSSMDRIDSAIYFLNKAVAVDSNFFWGYSGLGQNYLKINQYDKAILNLKKFLTYVPGNVDAKLLIANASFRAGDFPEAIRYFEICRAGDPENIKINLLLGRSYGMTGQYREALACLKNAHRIKPDDPEILMNIGVTHSILSEPDSAVDYYKRCIRLKPGYEQAYLYLISSFEKKGDKKNAAYWRGELAHTKDNAESNRK